MKIQTLLKNETEIIDRFHSEYVKKIRWLLLRKRLKIDGKELHSLVKTIVPKHVKKGLQLGVEWLNED